MVELAYTSDLKSDAYQACGFESRPRHHQHIVSALLASGNPGRLESKD